MVHLVYHAFSTHKKSGASLFKFKQNIISSKTKQTNVNERFVANFIGNGGVLWIVDSYI